MVYVRDNVADEKYQFVEKKWSASKEIESKCSESRRISKLRSPGSCLKTPGPEVRGGYGVIFSRLDEVLILDSNEGRKVLWGVCSSEEPLSQKLSTLNPKPRFSTSSKSKIVVSCPRESGCMDRPSSIFADVCGLVQTDVMDEGVQEVERRVGVVQVESSKVKDMGEAGDGEAGDEKEKSLCKLRIEKRRYFVFLKSVVAVGTGEPALSRASSFRDPFS